MITFGESGGSEFYTKLKQNPNFEQPFMETWLVSPLNNLSLVPYTCADKNILHISISMGVLAY